MRYPQNKLVPKRKRLSVYKIALALYENNDRRLKTLGMGLCLSLACILWDLPDYLSEAPNGQEWYYSDTVTLFPELAIYLPEIRRRLNRANGYEVRADVLKKMINLLEDSK